MIFFFNCWYNWTQYSSKIGINCEDAAASLGQGEAEVKTVLKTSKLGTAYLTLSLVFQCLFCGEVSQVGRLRR